MIGRDSIDAVQLWDHVRHFSDVEQHALETKICAFYDAIYSRPSREAPACGNDDTIELHLGETTQYVRVGDFVRLFLNILHQKVPLPTGCNAPTSRASSNMATLDQDEVNAVDFPPLTSNQTAKKPAKRRITTTLLTSNETTVVARPVPAAISFPPLQASDTANQPSVWTKRSLLEKRITNSSPAISKPNVTVWNSSPALKKATVEADKAPSSLPTVNPKSRTRQVSHWPSTHHVTQVAAAQELVSESLSEKKKPSQRTAPCVNYPAAKLYGLLIKKRIVPNTCVELQLVLSLLSRTDCTTCCTFQKAMPAEKKDQPTAPTCLASEFCLRSQCLAFAITVLHEIEPVLERLSPDLVGLVLACVRQADGQCVDLIHRLEHVVEHREDLRVAESARIGCHLPVETKAKAVHDFALPFHAATDSRLHFRTPGGTLVYTNRECVRDDLLKLVRQFQQKQHSVKGIEDAGARAAARAVLAAVRPENKWWFATFFVLELIQVGSNPLGESDKELVDKILDDKHGRKHPDRLCKLHRRFSRQTKASTKTSLLSTGHSSEKSARDTRKLRKATCQEETEATLPAMEHVKRLFSDNELFFFHFLASCDSYEFTQLVSHQLRRHFDAMQSATTRQAADARLEFTSVVLRLKVVAKFLGYLRFAPQWHVSSSIQTLGGQNAAFQALEREGIETLEIAHDAQLDVMKLLEKSILDASIAKCIPWLSDYLSMLSFDRLSLRTSYFQKLIVLLQCIHRSRRLDSLGETGFYIAMQIERILQLLHVENENFEKEDVWKKGNLLPSFAIRKLLADEETLETHPGEDTLRFLYNQVLLQTCVSELDDLRGFLQTCLQPRQERGKRVTTSSSQPVAPIRKLRPLQVILEESRRNDDVNKPENETLEMNNGQLPGIDKSDTLSDALFKVHPKTKVVVDFVVANVTTDVCEYVLAHLVLPRADRLVARCVSDTGLLSKARDSLASEDARLAARASFEMLLSSQTGQEATATVAAALDAALGLADERVKRAMPSLLSPSFHPSFTLSVVHVALEKTQSALRALVAKSAQTEFIKRIASLNTKTLKDCGFVSSTGRDATASHETVEELRCRELKRHVAALATSVGLKRPSLFNVDEWETRTTAVALTMSHVMLVLRKCDECGDWTSASALNGAALVVWDLLWRGITSCLTFVEMSLTAFTAWELAEEQTICVENVWKAFVETFGAMLQVMKRSVGESSERGKTRIETLLVYVMECVLKLRSKRQESKKDENRLVVEATALVVAKVREMVSLVQSEAEKSKE